MNERDELRLRHMRDAAEAALRFAQSKSPDNLEHDLLLTFAILHAIQIIGESASRITIDERARHPEIEWQSMIGMRHRVVHDYGNINYDIVRQVLDEKLPQLLRQLDAILPPFVEDDES
jgi:uncharacterized protein with HEPN domain